MSYELYWRKVGGEKIWSMPSDNDNDSNDGGCSGDYDDCDYDDGDDEDDIDDDDSRGGSVERKCGVCPNDTDPLPPLPTAAPAQEPMLTTIVMILMM